MQVLRHQGHCAPHTVGLTPPLDPLEEEEEEEPEEEDDAASSSRGRFDDEEDDEDSISRERWEI